MHFLLCMHCLLSLGELTRLLDDDFQGKDAKPHKRERTRRFPSFFLLSYMGGDVLVARSAIATGGNALPTNCTRAMMGEGGGLPAAQLGVKCSHYILAPALCHCCSSLSSGDTRWNKRCIWTDTVMRFFDLAHVWHRKQTGEVKILVFCHSSFQIEQQCPFHI